MSTSNVPALRFPGFSGEWNKVKLLEISSLITKGTTPKSFVAEGINFIKIECFVGSTISKNKCLFIDEKTHTKELKRSILQEGDILFAIAGATIGKCSVVTRDVLPANTNQALSIIRIKDQNSISFVYNNLRSDLMKKYILDNISVGAQPNLNLEQMGNFPFSLPSLPEQQKIASFLMAIDARIDLLTKKKTLLEQYKKGVMQQLFSQQIRFKDEEGNNFPEWEEKTLKDVATKIQDGTHFSPNIEENGEYLYLTSKNIKNGYIDLSSAQYVSAEAHKSIYKRCDVKPGDVLLTKDGTIGQVCVNELLEPFSLLSSVSFIRLNSEHSNYFLYHLLSSPIGQREIDGQIAGQALKRITLSKINNFKYYFPCYSEQIKIANFLSAVDSKINLVNTQLQSTRVYKKGLLDQLFV